MASTSIQPNNTNGISCQYCEGVGRLILIENLFKLKNLGSGVEYCLHPQNRQYLLGRTLDAHIPITNSTGISRRHAYVWVGDDAKLYIRDTESSNGTYVNGRKLTPGKARRIKVHDIISFGFPCTLARCETHAAVRHAIFKVMRNLSPVIYQYKMHTFYQ